MSAHASVDPRSVEVHTEQARRFQDRYELMARNPYATTFAYGRHKIEQLIDREISGLPAGARALDVGCGTGFNVARLSGRGFETVAIEPAEGMPAISASRQPAHGDPRRRHRAPALPRPLLRPGDRHRGPPLHHRPGMFAALRAILEDVAALRARGAIRVMTIGTGGPGDSAAGA